MTIRSLLSTITSKADATFKGPVTTGNYELWRQHWVAFSLDCSGNRRKTMVNFRDTSHWLRKFGRTVRMLSCLFCARMFGMYRHSGWDGTIEYARYNWCGKDWIIPTTAVQEESEL